MIIYVVIIRPILICGRKAVTATILVQLLKEGLYKHSKIEYGGQYVDWYIKSRKMRREINLIMPYQKKWVWVVSFIRRQIFQSNKNVMWSSEDVTRRAVLNIGNWRSRYGLRKMYIVVVGEELDRIDVSEKIEIVRDRVLTEGRLWRRQNLLESI